MIRPDTTLVSSHRLSEVYAIDLPLDRLALLQKLVVDGVLQIIKIMLIYSSILFFLGLDDVGDFHCLL